MPQPARKVLLDECIDRRLGRELRPHTVKTVPQAGWAGLKNGRLLRLAQKDFDVFLTVDRNLSFQQHLPRFTMAVLILKSRSNRLQDLLQLVPEILEAIPALQPSTVNFIGQ